MVPVQARGPLQCTSPGKMSAWGAKKQQTRVLLPRRHHPPLLSETAKKERCGWSNSSFTQWRTTLSPAAGEHTNLALVALHPTAAPSIHRRWISNDRDIAFPLVSLSLTPQNLLIYFLNLLTLSASMISSSSGGSPGHGASPEDEDGLRLGTRTAHSVEGVSAERFYLIGDEVFCCCGFIFMEVFFFFSPQWSSWYVQLFIGFFWMPLHFEMTFIDNCQW